MPDTFPPFDLAGPLDLGGISLARTISRLGATAGSPATFFWDESTDLTDSWDDWGTTVFSPILAPAFVAMHRHASEMRPDEILAEDLALDRALPETLRLRSQSAARPFLSGKEEMRAHRAWTRVAVRITEGAAPGHLTTLFALQTALYHLPLASALSAYVWFELESGLPASYRDRTGSAYEALTLFAAALPQVRLAMGADRGDFSGDAPQLRAI